MPRSMPKRPPRLDRDLAAPADLAAASPPHRAWQGPGGSLWLADVMDLLGTLPDGSVDLVVTDPPYAIGKADWDEFASLDAYVDWCDRWLAEVARVLAPHGSAYVCGFSEILADVKARSARRFAGCRWLVWYYKNKANLGATGGGRTSRSCTCGRRATCASTSTRCACRTTATRRATRSGCRR
jgi:site-specific DNA-methyltransferase (adenine-specific)